MNKTEKGSLTPEFSVRNPSVTMLNQIGGSVFAIERRDFATPVTLEV